MVVIIPAIKKLNIFDLTSKIRFISTTATAVQKSPPIPINHGKATFPRNIVVYNGIKNLPNSIFHVSSTEFATKAFNTSCDKLQFKNPYACASIPHKRVDINEKTIISFLLLYSKLKLKFWHTVFQSYSNIFVRFLEAAIVSSIFFYLS